VNHLELLHPEDEGIFLGHIIFFKTPVNYLSVNMTLQPRRLDLHIMFQLCHRIKFSTQH